MIYLDCAATSLQKPASVRRAVGNAVGSLSSPGRGGHRSAMAAAEVLLDCREELAALFYPLDGAAAEEASDLPQPGVIEAGVLAQHLHLDVVVGQPGGHIAGDVREVVAALAGEKTLLNLEDNLRADGADGTLREVGGALGELAVLQQVGHHGAQHGAALIAGAAQFTMLQRHGDTLLRPRMARS